MLTKYQKFVRSWKPMSADGRAARRNTKVMEWPVIAPNNRLLPPQDLRRDDGMFWDFPLTAEQHKERQKKDYADHNLAKAS